MREQPMSGLQALADDLEPPFILHSTVKLVIGEHVLLAKRLAMNLVKVSLSWSHCSAEGDGGSAND